MNSKTCKDKNIKENKNAVEVDNVKDIDNVLDGLLGDIASEKKDSSLTAEQNFSYGLSNPSSLKLAPSIVASNVEDKGTTSIDFAEIIESFQESSMIYAFNSDEYKHVVECLYKVTQIVPFELEGAENVQEYLLEKKSSHFFSMLDSRLKAFLNYKDRKKLTKSKVYSIINEFISLNLLLPIFSSNSVILLNPNNIELVKGKVNVTVHDYYDDDELLVYNNNFIDKEGNQYVLYCLSSTIFQGDEIEVILDRVNQVAYFLNMVTPYNLVLGRVMVRKERVIIVPDDPKLKNIKFVVKDGELKDANLGSIVICKIIRRSTGHVFYVEIQEILGSLEKLDVQIKLAILNNSIPNDWNPKVKSQLAKISDVVLEKDMAGRVDLRKLPLVTIDGADARDFDDAVYCKKEENGFRLYVAIADVSTYVKTNSALDQEARLRGTSIYFPNYVVPMLPEKLSNGLCSLNPHVDRLCMVCEAIVSKAGDIEEYTFYPAVMNSHARFTYTEVASILAGNAPSDKEFKPLVNDLHNLYDLFKALKDARTRRGGIEFESEEMNFIFDADLNIADIVPVERNDAHKIIEECMIVANICAAKFVEYNEGCALFRDHAKPSDEKVLTFRNYIAQYGYQLGGNENPQSIDYANFVRSIEDSPLKKTLCMMMLRSLSLAEYSPENIGHFGLALSHYAHFTSPIRRYPDLILHRVIKNLLGKTNTYPKVMMRNIGGKEYTRNELLGLADSCNMTERRADAVTGKVAMVLKAKFMEKFIGKCLEARISNVTHLGLFVTIDRYQVDGLIHVSNLGMDYFEFEPERMALIGTNSGAQYKIGQELTVVISSVDTETGHIDLRVATAKEKKNSPSIEVISLNDEDIMKGYEVNTVIRDSFEKWQVKNEPNVISDDGFGLIKKEKTLKSYQPKIKKKNKDNVKSKSKLKDKEKEKSSKSSKKKSKRK